MTKSQLFSKVEDLVDYVRWAKEAIDKEDWAEAESNLSMLCDDADKLYNEVEKRVK